MDREFDFGRETPTPSLGRNGRMTTTGLHVRLWEGVGARGDRDELVLSPVNSRGDLGRCEIAVDVEHAGDVGAFIVEAFCRGADPGARQALLERLQAICAGEPDPARAPAAPGPGR